MKKTGFTLIELLVVVLITGLLAAIALPMYQRAAERSKISQLKILVKNIAEAQERYFLANNGYANDFASLDLTLGGLSNPSASTLGPTVSSADAVRRFENLEIILNNSGLFKCVTGSTNNGKYKGAYITYCFVQNAAGAPLRQLVCMEDTRTTVYTAPAGEFCLNVAGFKASASTANNARYYTES